MPEHNAAVLLQQRAEGVAWVILGSGGGRVHGDPGAVMARVEP
jgi:hypothetical protein